jgi:hypothetical protein
MSFEASADRLGQVLSGQALQADAQEGGADSAPEPVVQAPTDISAAGIVLENQRQSVSEGVASVGDGGGGPQVSNAAAPLLPVSRLQQVVHPFY